MAEAFALKHTTGTYVATLSQPWVALWVTRKQATLQKTGGLSCASYSSGW